MDTLTSDWPKRSGLAYQYGRCCLRHKTKQRHPCPKQCEKIHLNGSRTPEAGRSMAKKAWPEKKNVGTPLRVRDQTNPRLIVANTFERIAKGKPKEQPQFCTPPPKKKKTPPNHVEGDAPHVRIVSVIQLVALFASLCGDVVRNPRFIRISILDMYVKTPVGEALYVLRLVVGTNERNADGFLPSRGMDSSRAKKENSRRSTFCKLCFACMVKI